MVRKKLWRVKIPKPKHTDTITPHSFVPFQVTFADTTKMKTEDVEDFYHGQQQRHHDIAFVGGDQHQDSKLLLLFACHRASLPYPCSILYHLTPATRFRTQIADNVSSYRLSSEWKRKQ